MDLRDSRFLVAGATGALGSRLARARDAAGVRVALAGREASRVRELADPDALVAAIVEALRTDRRELRYDPMKREVLAQ